MQMGWFYPPHRAGMDVTALAMLLSHRLHGGIPVLSHILHRAMTPSGTGCATMAGRAAAAMR